MYSSTLNTSITQRSTSSPTSTSSTTPLTTVRAPFSLWRPYLDEASSLSPFPAESSSSPSQTPLTFTRPGPAGQLPAQRAVTTQPPVFNLRRPADATPVTPAPPQVWPRWVASGADGRFQSNYPISREILNRLLHLWHDVPATLVYENGLRAVGQRCSTHYAAALRAAGIPMGQLSNSALTVVIRHFDPALEKYADQRVEPSVERFDLSVVPYLKEHSRCLKDLFEELTRDGQACTIDRFLREAAARTPEVSALRAWHWYYEDLRPGQVIHWRTEESLRDTSHRLPVPLWTTPASQPQQIAEVLRLPKPTHPLQTEAMGRSMTERRPVVPVRINTDEPAATPVSQADKPVHTPAREFKLGWLTMLMRETVGWSNADILALLRSTGNALGGMSPQEVSRLRHDYAQYPEKYPAPVPIPGLDRRYFDAWTLAHAFDGTVAPTSDEEDAKDMDWSPQLVLVDLNNTVFSDSSNRSTTPATLDI